MKELEEAVIGLIKRQPFYTHMALRMHTHITTSLPAAAGVGLRNGKVNLYINPEKFNHEPIAQRIAILEHEMEHIVCDHIGKRSLKGQHNLDNYAADLAVNCNVKNLPDYVVTVQKMRQYIPDLVENETIEYYRAKLKQFADELPPENLSGDHSMWGEGEYDREALRSFLRGCKDSYRGSLSGDLAIKIDNVLKSKTDWRGHLTNFIASRIDEIAEYTRKKANRRTGILNEGKRLMNTLHIAVAVDNSGSMSDELIAQGFAEIDKIVNLGNKVTVFSGDTQVNNVFEYQPGMSIDITGGGGTAYQPFLDKAREMDVDGLIVFGDMGCESLLVDTGIQVLWAMTPGSVPPADFGISTTIEV